LRNKRQAVFNTSLSAVGKSSAVRTGRSPGSGLLIISSLPGLWLDQWHRCCDSSITVAGPRRCCTELPY